LGLFYFFEIAGQQPEEDEPTLPWFDVAERRQKEHQRRTVTRRCNDCSEMYCSSCYNRCHVKGQQAQHQWTPMLKCERCDYLLATVECFGCAAHPLWKEVHDLGHANATGRVYYHNAHIGAGKGGETSWDKPFGYDGSSKMCEGELLWLGCDCVLVVCWLCGDCVVIVCWLSFHCVLTLF